MSNSIYQVGSTYQVGTTIQTCTEFPKGVPCILYDGDSVLCEFRSVMFGEQQARTVCDILNNARAGANCLSRYC